jgi:RNA polymerase primary sigma factor
MQQVVAELAYPVVLSDRALRELAMLHRAQQARGLEHKGEASAGQLARDCGLAREHVLQLLAVDHAPGLPTAGPGVEDDAFEHVEQRLASAQLRSLPGGLSEREREVLRDRFGLGRPTRTLDDIAGSLGVSGERVRQIERRALEKVRAVALARRPLKPLSA